LCGFLNQSVSTPSSETRLSTPLEPMIAVFTAPDRISVPAIAFGQLGEQPGMTAADDIMHG
jgi:hypothetical protein